MGSDELAAQLRSRVLFVPWSAESVTTAAELAQELRNETGARGVVVVDQLTGKPEELTAWPHRTLRSRSTRVEPTDVAAVILPSYEALIEVRLPVDGFASSTTVVPVRWTWSARGSCRIHWASRSARPSSASIMMPPRSSDRRSDNRHRLATIRLLERRR
jgi:hypothetical protein